MEGGASLPMQPMDFKDIFKKAAISNPKNKSIISILEYEIPNKEIAIK